MDDKGSTTDDSSLIQIAYAGAINQIFNVLYAGIVEADGDAAAEAKASAVFGSALALARKARAAALAVVSQAI